MVVFDDRVSALDMGHMRHWATRAVNSLGVLVVCVNAQEINRAFTSNI